MPGTVHARAVANDARDAFSVVVPGSVAFSVVLPGSVAFSLLLSLLLTPRTFA